jgi:glutathione S-transferase
MQLYYYADACSRAAHIVLRELGLPFTPIAVDMTTRKAADGRELDALTPKGYVPVLVLEDGEVLTETIAILQYLADRRPGAVAPLPASFLHYRVLEWLSFIATELHKPFIPLFAASTVAAAKAAAQAALTRRFDYVEPLVGARRYLAGEAFSIADAYLYVVAGWAPDVGLDVARWPNLIAYRARIEARPAVQAALALERAS